MSDREEMMPNVPDGDDVLTVLWTADGHLDEGTIHTWLDGAFDESQAAVVEQHADSCAACRASIAEARGLIAGASRAVRALDAVASNVVPQVDVARTASRIVAQAVRAGAVDAVPVIAPKATRTRPWWNQPNVTRIAAALVLVVGGTLVFQRMGRDAGNRVASVTEATPETMAAPAEAPSVSQSALPSSDAAREMAPLATTDAAPTAAVNAATSSTANATAGVASGASLGAGAVAASPAGAVPERAMALKRSTAGVDGGRAMPNPAEAPTVVASKSNAVERDASASAADRIAREMDDRVAAGRGSALVSGAAQARRAESPPTPAPMMMSAMPTSPANSQLIVGTVIDEQKRPLANTMILADNRVVTTSDSAGRFSARITTDSVSLTARRIGFEPAQVRIADRGADRGADTLRADIVMRASRQMLASVVITNSAEQRARGEAVACWSVSADQRAADIALPRFIALPKSMSATLESQWYGWPASGASATVSMTSVGNVVLRGSSTVDGSMLSLELSAISNGWQGSALQRRNGVESTARITLRTTSLAMCK